MAFLPAHLLQHLEAQVLVGQLLLGEVKVLGFLRKEQSATCGSQQSVQSESLQHGPARHPDSPDTHHQAMVTFPVLNLEGTKQPRQALRVQ